MLKSKSLIRTIGNTQRNTLIFPQLPFYLIERPFRQSVEVLRGRQSWVQLQTERKQQLPGTEHDRKLQQQRQ